MLYKISVLYQEDVVAGSVVFKETDSFVAVTLKEQLCHLATWVIL